MSNTNEKMNKLREKLLDAALAANTEDARVLAETIAMMPPEDPILKVGVAEPKPGDDEALAKCVKLAKAALAAQGWVVLGDLPSAGETLHRMKKEGLDLFMAQGLPSFGETLDALLKVRPMTRGDLAQAMGFYMPPRDRTRSFPCVGSAGWSEKYRESMANWLKREGCPDGMVTRTHEVFVESPSTHERAKALFCWHESGGSISIRLPNTVSSAALREFACARDGLAFKLSTGKSPEGANPAEIVRWINVENLYLDFAEWERLSRSKASEPAKAEPTHWFVSNAPVNLSPGIHEVERGGYRFKTFKIGDVGSHGRAGRGPIALRWTHPEKPTASMLMGDWFIFPYGSGNTETVSGRVFDSIVSARAHLEELPAPQKTGDWLNPVEADAIGRPSFHGNYTAEKPAASDPGHVATHWFVPAAPFKANGDGLGVTSPDGATQFYTIASGRKVDRSPVPLRLKSGIVPPVIFGTWRLYRPGSSVAGAIFETLEEAKEHAALSEAHAPKKARYGILDISVGGPSTLTIVETVDGIPVSATARTFSPGTVLGTMLHAVAVCFKLGVVDLYGDSFREAEVKRALASVSTFMRGEPLRDLTEADRASFLRMATTIEWPRTYTIPTFKALPPLS